MPQQMPPVAKFSLPTPGQPSSAPPTTTATPQGMPPVAQFSLPGMSDSSQPQVTKGSAGQSIGGNLKSNLAALPGAIAGAGNAFLPAIGDIYNDVTGKNTKTPLQQAGDVVQTGLSAAMLIPGAQPEDIAAKAGLEGLGAKIGSNALAGGAIGASNAVGQGGSATQIAEQGLIGAGVGGLAGGASSLLKALTPAEKLQSAIEDATPSYSTKMIGEQPVKEGVFGRKVVPTPQNIEAGTEGAKIPNYPKNGTFLEKYNTVDPVIAQKGQALDQSLKDENVLRPPQELKAIIRTAANEKGEGSLLLGKSDPVIKNYLRVANRAVDQNEGTLYGERQVGKALDNAYEDAGGKYANNKPLDQIHRAVRTSLINDMESKAQNTEVKGSLKEMQNLYNFQDVLQDKAKSEGGTGLARFAKNNPAISKVAGVVGRYTGLDAALHLLP